MPVHPAISHLHKRQAPPPIPSAAGISGAASIADPNAATSATGLQINTSTGVPGAATQLAPDLASGFTPVSTLAPTSSSTQPSSSASASPASTSSASSQIATSTVVGACIGAFAGLVLIVSFAMWYNKRLSKSPKNRSDRGLGSPSARNADGEEARRRSRLEPWKKLDDGDDTWKGMEKQQAKEIDPGAMEKLTMFKKTPSLHSTEKDSEGHEIDLGGPPAFSKYHPQLAEEFAKTPERPFLGRLDTGEPISWGDAETLDGDSFLSLRNSHMNSGSMSPTMAVMHHTPPPVASSLHKWESAEVVQYEEATETRNPFADVPALERRKSVNNPFFNARDGRNPFSDAHASPVPIPAWLRGPSMVSHVPSDSSSDERLQSLIAALDVTPSGAQEATRVQSMHPSIFSQTSGMTEDIATAFPLPPTGLYQAS